MRYTVSLVAMLALLSSVMTASGAISSKPVVSVIAETWTCKEGEGNVLWRPSRYCQIQVERRSGRRHHACAGALSSRGPSTYLRAGRDELNVPR